MLECANILMHDRRPPPAGVESAMGMEWSVGGGCGQGNLIRRYVGRPAHHFCMQPGVGRRRLFLNYDAARYFGHTPRVTADVGRFSNLRHTHRIRYDFQRNTRSNVLCM